MVIEVKVPSPGESITSVVIAGWLVKDGELVSRDQEILEIDSDKATLTISAPEAGKIKIMAAEGDTVDVGSTIANIDTAFAASAPVAEQKTEKSETSDSPTPSAVEEKNLQKKLNINRNQWKSGLYTYRL